MYSQHFNQLVLIAHYPEFMNLNFDNDLIAERNVNNSEILYIYLESIQYYE